MLDLLDSALGRLGGLLHLLAKLCLLAMLLLINAEVVLRYLFGRSTLIADEYGGYLFCWLTLLGFLAAARDGQFLKVDLGTARLTGRAKEAAGIFASTAGLLVAAVLGYAACLLTGTSLRFNAVSAAYSETPLYLPQAVMVPGFALLALFYLEDILRRLVRLAKRAT